MPATAEPIRISVSRVSQPSLVLWSAGRSLKTSAGPILINADLRQHRPQRYLTAGTAVIIMAVVMQVHLIRQQSAAGTVVPGADQAVSVALPQLVRMFRLPLQSAARKAPVRPEAAAGQAQVVIAHLFHRIVRRSLAADKRDALG